MWLNNFYKEKVLDYKKKYISNPNKKIPNKRDTIVLSINIIEIITINACSKIQDPLS